MGNKYLSAEGEERTDRDVVTEADGVVGHVRVLPEQRPAEEHAVSPAGRACLLAACGRGGGRGGRGGRVHTAVSIAQCNAGMLRAHDDAEARLFGRGKSKRKLPRGKHHCVCSSKESMPRPGKKPGLITLDRKS